MVSGERQAIRIRGLYLQNILRQDIAFFDNETSSGQVIERMAGDTILIQDATGEKLHCSSFKRMASNTGDAVKYSSCRHSWWSYVINGVKVIKPWTKGLCEAGTVVEQTVGSIRTVVSFTGEKHAIENYTVKGAYQSAVHEGTVAGLGVGCVLFIIFSSYALAVWYGSQLIVHKGYSGGEAVNVMIAVMTGGMSLGQTSPCFCIWTSCNV